MKYLLLALLPLTVQAADVRIGSKNFTEGYLMGELVAQTLEQTGWARPERRFGLGGTGIVFEALKARQIDLYVEYTGTIQEAILKSPGKMSRSEMRAALAKQGLVISEPLGFSNTYALAVRRAFAEEHGLRRMSDLLHLPSGTRYGFSHEFFSRADGFSAMKAFYQLDIARDQASLMEHTLLYPALVNGKVDVIEVYSTDGKIDELDLTVLEDDARFFPEYAAVMLTTADFARSPVWISLSRKLAGSLTTDQVRRLNAQADLEKRSPRDVIAGYLQRDAGPSDDGIWPRVWKRTREHAVLVGVTMLFCILIGVPLGLFGLRAPLVAQGILLSSSLIQTIPSLALLCFLIPAFGIGKVPALVALFLYGLFPIVVNTYAGVSEVGLGHLEMAKALGMSRWQRLLWIEIPLASPHILNGIKTSAILTIGTATLAALIGAGGYGAPIITGLAMNDMPTIFIGAIPAAAMAILAHVVFMILNALLIPRGLRR